MAFLCITTLREYWLSKTRFYHLSTMFSSLHVINISPVRCDANHIIRKNEQNKNTPKFTHLIPFVIVPTIRNMYNQFFVAFLLNSLFNYVNCDVFVVILFVSHNSKRTYRIRLLSARLFAYIAEHCRVSVG